MNIQIDQLAIIVLAMAAGAFIKGVTGQGLPQVAIPVMATFLGVEAAVVIMAIPGVVTNTWLLWTYRRHRHETRDIPVLLVLGAVGSIGGTILLDRLDEKPLSLILAAVISLYAIVFFTHPEISLPARLTRFVSPPLGLAAGALQGATGMSGPLISTYLHGFRLRKEAYVLSITTIFQVFALVQVITLTSVGLYTSERLTLSLVSLVPVMALLPVGARLTDKLSRELFDYVVLTVLVLSAVKLVFDAFS